MPKSFLVLAFLAALAQIIPAAEKGPQKPERWEKAIQAFEAADKATPAPRGTVLLVGGSNARRWTNVNDYFRSEKVINRGFGGAQLSDVVYFIDRIVLPYAPKTIFLNAGGNDLAAGKTPEQVRDACKEFVAKVGAALPQAKIYYIAIPPVLKAAKAPESMAAIKHSNELMAELAQSDSRMVFINIFPAFLDDQGQPRPELFVTDGTHFSPKGCEIVAALMREKAGLKN